MRIHRKERAEGGFTLIEVMIAMTIMAVGLLTIGLAQLSALRMTNQSKQSSQAMYLAQEQLALFRANPVCPPTCGGTTNDPGNPIDVDPNDRDATTFNRSWNVQQNTPTVGMSTITVTVVVNNPEGGPVSNVAASTVQLQGIAGPVLGP